MMTEHAHIAKTRIGYTVHRTGLFFPEKATTWHPTLSRAIRAAERWGGTITVPRPLTCLARYAMIQSMETTTLTINGDLLAALVKALRENTLAADCRALNVVRQVVEEHGIDLGDE